MCCGVPRDEELNSCDRQAAFVVIGVQMIEVQGVNEMVPCVLACCGYHLEAVEAFQAAWDPELCATVDVSELGRVRDLLAGEDILMPDSMVG